MSYMLLILHKDGEGPASAAEGRERYDRMMRFAADLKERGKLVAAESLASPGEGLRIRKREGRQSVIDGPFAEAKEVVGGFFLLDCPTREEAAAIAATCPAAEWSTVELRGLAPCWEDPA